MKNYFKLFAYKFLKINCLKFHYLVLTKNVWQNNIKNKEKCDDLNIVDLSFEDFYKGDSSVFNETKLKVIKQKINSSNYHSFGIFENDLLVYTTWIGMNELELPLEFKYKLTPVEGYLVDSYCHPVARGKGLHSKMNVFRINKLFELGCESIIVIVLDGNEPAMKVQKKCGFEDMGTFKMGLIFGKRFCKIDKIRNGSNRRNIFC